MHYVNFMKLLLKLSCSLKLAMSLLDLDLCDLNRAYGVTFELPESLKLNGLVKLRSDMEEEREDKDCIQPVEVSKSRTQEGTEEHLEHDKTRPKDLRHTSSFSTNSLIQIHNHIELSNSLQETESRGKFHCEQCQLNFDNEINLKQHQLLKHCSVCLLCGKSFQKQISLLAHLPLHNEDKSYKCIICSKEFHVQKYFIRHLERHEKAHEVNRGMINRTFICSLCKKDFTKKEALAKHMRIHTRDSFRCSLCDFSCAKKVTLKMHVISHEGKRKYKCTQCNYSFKQIGHLKRHMSRFNHQE